MSIERAVKFCKTCHACSSYLSGNRGPNLKEMYNLLQYDSYAEKLRLREELTDKALLALEESLNKDTREPSGMENDPSNGSLDQVRKAMIACMNCDYSTPSIVDVFIMKSQDSK